MVVVSRNKALNRIFEKCTSVRPETLSVCLNESSLAGLLSEALDASDVKTVVREIDAAEKQLDDISKYFDQLENFDKGKIPSITEYLKDLKAALEKTRGELAVANFETGSVSKFLGQKLTLPQLTQASVTIHTKAQDFINGFSEAVKNIESNLGPLVKSDEDKSKPLRDIAGSGGMPEESKLKDGIKKAIKSALGGGFFQKVKAFFTQSMTGAEKKIMDSMPKLNADRAAEEVSEAFLDSTIESFSKSQSVLPKPEPADALQNVAKESQEAEEEAAEAAEGAGGETASEATSGDEPPPLTDEKEAQKEQDAATQELTAAVQDASKDAKPPGVAVMDALDAWYDGLSKSSQETISRAKRYDNLKSSVQTTMDDLASTVEDTIKSAVADWRGENEEPLIKSKRFAKKNFDSLEQTIPKLASFMIRKVNESPRDLTRHKIRSVVFEFLDRKFYKNTSNLLTGNTKPPYDDEDMIAYRMNKLAGLE